MTLQLGFLVVAGLFFLVPIFLFGVMGEGYTLRSNFKPPISLSFTLLFLLLIYFFPGKDKRKAGK